MEFALSTIRQDENDLNTRFFSRANVSSIQTKLQSRVYKKTQRIIDAQNEDDLFVIMRGIFVLTATNPDDDIDVQIQSLNDHVLDVIERQVLVGLKALEKYDERINSPLVPIARGLDTNKYGETNGELFYNL